MIKKKKDKMMESKNMDNLQSGIIMAIEQKADEFESLIPSLSKNALERLLKDAVRFPRSLPTTSEVEASALETLYAIKDLQVELAILTIGKLKEEKDEQIQSEQEKV
jgi:hypothetical protein